MKEWHEERAERATHNQGKVQNTQNKKQKPNMHKQQKPHRLQRHKCKYVTCRARLRYKNEKSKTITTPKKVTKMCSREHMPTPAHPLT